LYTVKAIWQTGDKGIESRLPDSKTMIVQKSDILLITQRRLFAEDVPRFFIGSVDHYEDGLVLISGYSWVRDRISGQMTRNDDIRTKVVSLLSGNFIVYQLPPEININALQLDVGQHQQLLISDGQGFSMDITDCHGLSL